MREPLDTVGVLDRAVAAFKDSTGLCANVKIEERDSAWPKAFIDVMVHGSSIRFAAEIKTADRFHTLGTFKSTVEATPHPILLVVPHITEDNAERCRKLHLSFIDESGNAYLEAPGLFVYVTNKRRPQKVRTAPTFRAFTPAGLRIVFALLHHARLINATYREIAKVAQVALGTVGEVLIDLEERGHLALEKQGQRRLLALERLQEDWVIHYPIKLRPKLNSRRFTATIPDWWQNQDIREYDAYWGGEVAADKLTGYLKPTKITVYINGKPDKFIIAYRLRPSINGEIEILSTFCDFNNSQTDSDIAPPLIVYADLVATIDPRNIETAKLIHEKYLYQISYTA